MLPVVVVHQCDHQTSLFKGFNTSNHLTRNFFQNSIQSELANAFGCNSSVLSAERRTARIYSSLSQKQEFYFA